MPVRAINNSFRTKSAILSMIIARFTAHWLVLMPNLPHSSPPPPLRRKFQQQLSIEHLEVERDYLCSSSRRLCFSVSYYVTHTDHSRIVPDYHWLTHGRPNGLNILTDRTGHITCINRLGKSSGRPFGVALYGLDTFLGNESEGYSTVDGYETLRGQFFRNNVGTYATEMIS
jgi:hypothetical protein